MTPISEWRCDCDSSAPLCRKHELAVKKRIYADPKGRVSLRNSLREQARILAAPAPERTFLRVISANEDRHPDGGSTLSRQFEAEHWRYDL